MRADLESVAAGAAADTSMVVRLAAATGGRNADVVTGWRSWRAAVSARLRYLLHGACGHAVVWRTSPPDLPLCSGDIVCHSCAQVLWCRAYDPWRAAAASGGGTPNDHWGGTHGAAEHGDALFYGLAHVLSLAERFPPGIPRDQVRRSLCEVIEAASVRERHDRLVQLLAVIDRLRRYGTGGGRLEDADSGALQHLLTALHREVVPIVRNHAS